MRVFNTFVDAKNEIGRDLNELGVSVYAGYQSMDPAVAGKLRESLTTKELQDYGYVVLQPSFADLNPTQPWADVEWGERLDGVEGADEHNPGHAWALRPEVWEPLKEPNGRFSYTYSQRLRQNNCTNLVRALAKNPQSRQIWVSIWDPAKDSTRLGKRRVPCSLGYQILVRNGKVNISYHMRSSDFNTHFDNDLFFALKLQEWFATQIELPRGSFTHVLGSLHAYAADISHIF